MHWEIDLDQGFYSSPLIMQDQLVLFDLDGLMLVMDPKPEKLIIKSKQSLGEKVVTTPAFAHNLMWIRGEKHLFGIGKKGASNDTP